VQSVERGGLVGNGRRAAGADPLLYQVGGTVLGDDPEVPIAPRGVDNLQVAFDNFRGMEEIVPQQVRHNLLLP
jgi:hypothetical protein